MAEKTPQPQQYRLRSPLSRHEDNADGTVSFRRFKIGDVILPLAHELEAFSDLLEPVTGQALSEGVVHRQGN